MKINNLYLVGLCILVLSAFGCDGRPTGVSSKPLAQKASVQAPVMGEAQAAQAEAVAVPAANSVVATPVAAEVKAPEAPRVSFGDYRSETLTTLAWQALERKDLATVIVYTNKCVSMYEKEASKMQASLKDYPSGDPKKIFSYWALNDVATSLLIQGEAYRKAGQKEKAKEAYGRVVKEFSFGQAYSPVSKTFWKPVLAAQDGLYMIEHDVDLDFGDMTSLAIVRQMWKANADGKLAEVIGYAMKLNSLYAEEAVRMQKSLNDFAAPPAENIHKYWALNDVATGMFILGEAYGKAGMKDEAIRAYSKVISDYGYAQCWDESGWFWKVAEGAQQRILDLQGIK